MYLSPFDAPPHIVIKYIMTSDLIFKTNRTISSAFIDSSVRLGIAQAILLVQDNLTECFGAMGCDGVVYREKLNALWVFTKTRVHFIRRPNWREKITASTFPVNNAGMRTHINTIFTDSDGKTLLTANQEACVLSLENHRPLRLTTLPYPTENFPAPVFEEPFEKFPKIILDEHFVYEQKIRSQHIDMSHHMNNIEYIKLALNVFDDAFLQKNEVKDLEVHYTGESTEGQNLAIFRHTEGNATFIAIQESDRCVFEMKIQF